MRRSISLGKGFRGSRSSFTGFVLTTSSTIPNTHQTASLSPEPSKVSQTFSRTSIDQEAAYWQDPEARHKLRLYLASPQNFDEAIEFGFPSNPDETDTTATSKSSSPSKKFGGITETVSDLDREPERVTTGLRPRPATSGGTERYIKHTTASTTTTTMYRPRTRLIESSAEAHVEGVTSNVREMTLRMTLTRKDLRATDDELYGWQQKNGPTLLEVAQHPNNDSFTAINLSCLPTGGKKNTATQTLKKLWKKVLNV